MLFSVEQAFVVRDERRAPLKTPAYEPRTSIKGLFSRNKKKNALYVSKGVKENVQSHQRSNPTGQEQKPQKNNKNVCMKQQLHDFKLYKDKWQNQNESKL